ncbi:hypothetical protein DXG01_000429 [Tephrocybe rancida]|nr:hypothetical protein DXG01_000429 [Tephrocybe rancida]
MSLLFRHLRVHHVFGANTDVGKTILTTALVRASAKTNNAFYLKPVSTGNLSDADTFHVDRHANSNRVFTECLYQYSEPVSPHLAAKLDKKPPISDSTLVNTIAAYIRRTAHTNSSPAHLYVETAGGVHSPTLSGTTQADAYRSLFLPTILIADSRLGGISTTIAAYEALLLRGYILDAVLLFRDDYYKNYEYLSMYFSERGVYVAAFEQPPERLSSPTETHRSTEEYYQRLVSPTGGVLDAVKHLTDAHTARIAELDSIPERTLKSIWWPFVQHAHVNSVNVIDSAHSDFFSVYAPTHTTSLLSPQLDSSASWWTQTFGHAHTRSTLAAARAAGRYGHVMFPGSSHLPALQLAEALLDGPGKGWAHRVFISDNGSTGMEVGLKMALRAFTRRTGRGGEGGKEQLGVLGLTGSYHGDTIGAMDACEPGVYTCEWHSAKGVWLDPPTVSFRSGRLSITLPASIAPASSLPTDFDDLQEVYNVPARLGSPLALAYKAHIEGILHRLEEARLKARSAGEATLRLAALVLEPLVLGAGGMRFVDPLFQRILMDVVRLSDPSLGLCPSPPVPSPDDFAGLPIIHDEVFTGLYRLSLLTPPPLLGPPDIAVHAKVLTGGLVPLASTMAKEGIFNAFLGEGKESALLHGHSYSAHAVGCAVAVETLKEIGEMERGVAGAWEEARGMWGVAETKTEGEEEGEQKGQETKVWSFWDPDFVLRLSEAPRVEEVMTLGCVLAIKISSSTGGYTSHAAQETLKPLSELHLASDSHATQAPGGAPYAVHYRTLGNVAYFMTSLNTSAEVVREVEDRIWGVLGA